RNLVVYLDGTGNQFGHRSNTNVVELHNRILKDDPDVPQLTFYSSGIGTYVPPSSPSLAHWLHNFDKAFAWGFKLLIEEAYGWIADHYQPGDRLFLFGFSRGAYQVRALAGMIEKVRIPLLLYTAFHIYQRNSAQSPEALVSDFKLMLARAVKVHFVGVWDIVSSVGISRTPLLPLTTTAFYLCSIRHALVLDGRRVKFLPEYLAGDQPSPIGSGHYEEPPDAKEVWFPGSHSDMYALPLLWMENEAGAARLKLEPRRGGLEWRWGDHHPDKPKNTLSWLWWPLEFLPLKHLRYTDKESTTRYFYFQASQVV
ncbi:hypothetical protein EDD18DRAFT_1081975, partial [Armillaria luteobubalina]